MRLLRVVIFVAATSAIAAAGSKIPLRVVRVLLETHQALLYDRTADTHVLVEVGKSIDGYVVEDIDDDEVTLAGGDGQEVVLAGPDWHHHDAKPAPAAAEPQRVAPSANPAVANLAAPAANPAVPAANQAAVAVAPSTEPAPEDPYAPQPIRVVEAPGATPSLAPIPTVTPAMAPAGAPSPTPIPNAPPAPAVAVITAPAPAPAPAPALAPAPAPAPVPVPVPTLAVAVTPAAPNPPVTPAAPNPPATPAAPAPPAAAAPALPMLGRAEVAAAIANFGTLAASIHGSFTPDGARLDAIQPDSLFAKVGLRAGDVIAAVDGRPMRSLDDAAILYARAPDLKGLTLAVIRAGKPLTLHVIIQ